MFQRQIDIKAEDVPSLNDARQVESLVKAITSHVHSFHKVCAHIHFISFVVIHIGEVSRRR